MKKTIKYLLIFFTLVGSLNSSAQMRKITNQTFKDFERKKLNYTNNISFSEFVKQLKDAANTGKDYTLENCAIIYDENSDKKYINYKQTGFFGDIASVILDEAIYFQEETQIAISNCYLDHSMGAVKIQKLHTYNLVINNLVSYYGLELDSIKIANSLQIRDSDLGIEISNSTINRLSLSMNDTMSNGSNDFSLASRYLTTVLKSNNITSCAINNLAYNIYLTGNTFSYLYITDGNANATTNISNNIFKVDFKNIHQIRQINKNKIRIYIRSGIRINELHANKLLIRKNSENCLEEKLTNESLIKIIKIYKDSIKFGITITFKKPNTEEYEFNKLQGDNWFELITKDQLALLEQMNKENDSLEISLEVSTERIPRGINILESELNTLSLDSNTLPAIFITNNKVNKQVELKNTIADSGLVMHKNTLPSIDRIAIDKTIFRNLGFYQDGDFYSGQDEYNKVQDLFDHGLYKENLNQLIITYKKFIKILEAQGNDAESTGILELKDIQSNIKMHKYYDNSNIENWFNWKGSVFLRWYSDYGTNPFKALAYCFRAILYFALFYFFFYSDWDKIDRGFLIKRFSSVMDYFTTEKRIEDFYAATHDQEMTTFTKFKNTLDKNKIHMPGMLVSLAKPIYQISLLRYKLLNFSYKKAEFMAGRKWIDLEKKDRYWIGTLTFFLTITYIIYLVFIRALNSIVLSINAFSTLGFGQIPVRGFTKYVAIIEGFIGWFLLSIFLVSVLSQMMNV